VLGSTSERDRDVLFGVRGKNALTLTPPPASQPSAAVVLFLIVVVRRHRLSKVVRQVNPHPRIVAHFNQPTPMAGVSHI
jgi:hypothetical protein